MDDKVLRDHLTKLLKGEQAHASNERALKNIDFNLLNKTPVEGMHTLWELMEHLRLAQEDILKYMLQKDWVSPKWPDGYWPNKSVKADKQLWQDSASAFLSDLDDLINLVNDPHIELTSQIPHAPKHTYLREFLIAADHNSYHIGQLVETRKILGNW